MERKEQERWVAAMAATLRAERGLAAISQAEVERRTGISRSSYRLYEQGVRNPDALSLALIAEAFGITPSRLISETERRADPLADK